MAKNREITESDKNLFRNSIGDVARIKQDTVALKTRSHAPVPARWMTETQEKKKSGLRKQVQQEITGPGDGLFFRKPGIQNRVIERLRRGQMISESELDLHGMTAADAGAALTRFLECCRKHDYLLNNKLPQCHEVLAFCSARANDGGTGALYILLKTDN
jgi:DNA-nicking Smr family endonuclease